MNGAHVTPARENLCAAHSSVSLITAWYRLPIALLSRYPQTPCVVISIYY